LSGRFPAVTEQPQARTGTLETLQWVSLARFLDSSLAGARYGPPGRAEEG